MPNSYNYGRLDTRTILYLTAIKFEPFVFPMLGFVFACFSNIYIIVSLYDFCLFPTHFFYVNVYVRNLEHSM